MRWNITIPISHYTGESNKSQTKSNVISFFKPFNTSSTHLNNNTIHMNKTTTTSILILNNSDTISCSNSLASVGSSCLKSSSTKDGIWFSNEFIFLSSPGMIWIDLGHIGGSIHSKNPHPLNFFICHKHKPKNIYLQNLKKNINISLCIRFLDGF